MDLNLTPRERALMAFKPIYRNRDEWVLCKCTQCGALNYVEPHGTTADCKLCGESTEHTNIPHDQRDISGCYYIGRKKK